MLSIAIALQAANIAPPIDFDLGKMKPPETDCRADAAGSGRDIIVCASRDKQEYSRVTAEETPPEGMPKAEFGLFGKVRGKVNTEQVGVGGFPSNRAKVTITVPF